MNESFSNSLVITSTSIGPFAMLLIIIVGVWGVMMWLTAMKNHQGAGKTDVRVCSGCATPNPGHAGFCRNCGKKL